MENQQNSNPAAQRDFSANPQDYFKISDYDARIAPVIERIEALETRVGDNACLASSFKDAFDNDKKMDKVLTELVVELIKKDESVRDAVKHSVTKVDRDWQKSAFKKIGFAAWSISLSLASGGLVYLFVK